MSTTNTAVTSEISGKALTLSRVFNAPRELVFKMWTTPEHIKQWWGPRFMIIPVMESDLRVGGLYRFVMTDQHGNDYIMKGSYLEVVKNKKIVYDANLDEHPADWHKMIESNLERKPEDISKDNVVTITFEDAGENKTKVSVITEFRSAEMCAAFVKTGVIQGWTESLERFEYHISDEKRELSVTRVLNAPRELVWKMWTEPEHIKNWWGPNGFTNTILKMEVKPGGEWEFVMHGPDGTDYKNKHIYLEIEKPHLIVMQHVTHPKFVSTVRFYDKGQQTWISIRSLFESSEQLAQVIKVFKADEGLKQNMDRLEEYLEKLDK